MLDVCCRLPLPLPPPPPPPPPPLLLLLLPPPCPDMVTSPEKMENESGYQYKCTCNYLSP
jgi:hypothetical protein